MASEEKVRSYLAYWFQLGKKVVLKTGDVAILPCPVFKLNQYSDSFEDCWNQLSTPENRESYLEGTVQTIPQLLTSEWDILPCARCNMPIPMIQAGFDSGPCPCSDQMSWPNNQLPSPRSPIDQTTCLRNIQSRILNRFQSDEVLPRS
jgi:hypothetical protein